MYHIHIPFVILMLTFSLTIASCGKKPASIEPPPNAESLTVYPRPFPKREAIPGNGPQHSAKILKENETSNLQNGDSYDPFSITEESDDTLKTEPLYPMEPLNNATEEEEGLLF